MTSLKLFVLGPPRLERDKQRVALPLRRAVALLVHLAVTDQPQSRETLAALLWPESDEGEARGRLRRTLHRLGDAVEGGLLIADASALRLSPDADLWVDALAFRQHAAAGLVPEAAPDGPDSGQLAHLTQAAVLYADDFLAGFTLSDSPAWDEWQFDRREDLRRTCARVLERLASVHRAQAEWEAGIGAARRWLALDPLHEPAHRALMEVYAQAGQFAAAQRQYQECARVLAADLGVSPEDETARLYEAIRARRLTPIPDGGLPPAVAPKPHAPARHRLPPQPTPFIGRTRDLATLRQLLVDEPSCRLVTLVGPGGIGKTRLALEAAAAAIPQFSDGIFFAPLAPIDSPDHIVFALAEHLDVRFHPAAEPKRQLLDALREQQLLLVVDNFEHLVDAAPLLTEILAAAQRVKLLVTSRERLNLSGEAVYTVGGMVVPDAASPRTALDCDAVHLLMHRARMVRPDLEVRDYALDSIVRICRLVQGMPLAIELAAGWLEALSFTEIADEIARGFDLLEGQTRDLPARQRSVRATFDHSWARLAADEQRTFMQLSVFRGGFTRQAAEAMTGAGLRGLRALVNRSFLSPGADDRYQIHELLRQYGAERLEASGKEAATRERHAAWCLALAERAGEALDGPQRGAWLGRLEVEHDNLRAALVWFDQTKDAPRLLRLAGSLWRFWYYRGHVSEGRAWSERALAAAAAEPASSARARALLGVGALRWQSGETGSAAAPLEEAVALFRALGDRAGTAWTLNALGCLISDNGDLDRGAHVLREARTIFVDLDDKVGRAQVEGNLGEDAFVRGDFALAARRLEAVLELQREIGDTAGAARVLTYLGNAVLGQGDLARAHALLTEAATALLASGYVQAIPDALRGLARVAWRWGDGSRAATIFGAEEALRARLGALLPPAVHREWLERDIAAIRQALGDAAFAAAWADGRALGRDEAVALAVAAATEVDA